MRYLATIALAGVSLLGVTPCQSLPLAAGGTNAGNTNNGLYFDITVNTTITLTSVDYRCNNNAVGPHQSSFNLFVGPSTWVNNVAANPGPWVLVGSSTPVSITGGTGPVGTGPIQNMNGVLNPAGANPGTITLPPGTYGLAFQAVNHAWVYTTGAGNFSNAHLSATLGGASNAFLALPTFSPRTFNGALNYTLGGTPMTFAQREPYGKGCYANYRSFYELWPSSVSLDVPNTSMYLTLDTANNRYSSVVGGTTPILPPVSASLGHLDDNNITVALANAQPILFPNIGGLGVVTTTVEMCSNGYINLLGTNLATQFNPTVAAFMTGTPRIGNWHDFDPPGTGTVPANPAGSTHYDYNVASASHVFTWLNCHDSGAANSPSTFQLAFFANGDVEFRWGTMALNGGTWPTLVGFTPGAGSLDPGSKDLTASFPFLTQGFDQDPLKLTGDVNPVLGSTVNLATSGQTGTNIGLCFVTLADLPPFSPVGLDLGVIGAPGCVANVDINQGVGNVISNLGVPFPSMTVPFAIPGGPPTIIGLSFFCQSVWLDGTQNAAGLITSNALRLKIGAF